MDMLQGQIIFTLKNETANKNTINLIYVSVIKNYAFFEYLFLIVIYSKNSVTHKTFRLNTCSPVLIEKIQQS